MEHINPSRFNRQDEPEDTGGSKASKKKKKISRVPLSLNPEQIKEESSKSADARKSILDLVDFSGDAEKDTTESDSSSKKRNSRKRRKKSKSELGSSVAEGESTADSVESVKESPEIVGTVDGQKQESELSDKEQSAEAASDELESYASDDSEYFGELIIDHSDEAPSGAGASEEFVSDYDLADSLPDQGPELVTDPVMGSEPNVNVDVFGNFFADHDSSPEALLPTIDYESFVNSPESRQDNREPFRYESDYIPVTDGAKAYNQVAGSKTISEAAYRAEKRGLSKGVTTGLLFGWLIGRRGKAYLEKRVSSMEESHMSQLESLQSDFEIQKNLSKQRLGIIEKTKQNVSNMASELKRRSNDVEIVSREAFRSKVAPIIESISTTPKEKSSYVVHKSPESASPVFAVAETSRSTEKKRVIESTPDAGIEHAEHQERPQTRREVSAWHSYDVDASTGKLAKESSVEYGEAFQSELQQERLAHAAAVSHTAAQVGTALFASGGVDSSDGNTANATQTAAGQNTDDAFDIRKLGQIVADTSKEVGKNMASPSTWLVAGTVFAVIYLLGMFG